MSKKPTKDSASSDGPPDRRRDSASPDVKKPDSRKPNLDSPDSTLPTRPSGRAATTTNTSTSSSSSSGSVSSRLGPRSANRRPESGRSTQSGDPSGSSGSIPTTATPSPRASQAGSNSAGSSSKTASGSSPKTAAPRPRASQTGSGSGTTQPRNNSGQSSSAASPAGIIFRPSGNISQLAQRLKATMPATPRTRRDIIGSGTGVYGYGSVVRGTIKRSGSDGGSPREIAAAMSSADPVEVNRIGNEVYKKGNFADALRLYDRAIELSPRNVSYMSNRAAALMGLNRIGEAIKGCEEALRFNPNHGRAHQRLASLFIRIGQVEEADKHFRLPGFRLDPSEVQNLQAIDKHLSKCADARGHSNWRTVLKEVDAAILSGANFSPQLVLCRAEALMMLNRLDDARSILSEVPKVEPFPESCSQKRFCGMLCEAYTHFVKSRIDLALGRFESAATASAKAVELDRRNYEVSTLANTVTLVTSARNRGNELYRSERYTEASTAYEEGLRHDPTNSVLYSNRAACWFKLGKWERTIEDCDQALNFQPNYTKALLRRAAANSKLERWGNAVMDYEAVRRELPDDKEIAESLFHAQVALRKSRGDDVSNMRFGGEVEEISSLEQFKAAVSLPGVSVVHFMKASDDQCKEISPFVDALCIRYPFLNFLKVDIDKWTEISREENVKVVPTFKIYKNGNRVKEIICPNREVLDYSVRYYSL